MGRRGWAGVPPADDAQARERIIDAAIHSVALRGAAGTTLSNVATDLGVIRKTVYRYFTSTEELFAAVSDAAAERFVAQFEANFPTDVDDIADFLVEAMAFIIERFPDEPLLMLLLAGGYPTTFSRRMMAPAQIARVRTILVNRRVNWAELGYDDEMLDQLVEHVLRIMQSLILAPPDPPRTGQELRTYLRRWVGPVLFPASQRVPRPVG
ncbi:TetR/AcrR family transcriptional regulator [Parafrankia sp. EUN1f]|uniref:TetR/AcrR family transcriptional regulator n=1 Tax=Parafrankia sp. EUN1f TaxID=102897 RepID=UPI0001C44287|nr:TetR/AcrR family transcriptional regulator [Parafrankia sp. EUN1f]EFC85366.1 transcriptional regulator, TetR family [Parafrankia sp. EUN1f]